MKLQHVVLATGIVALALGILALVAPGIFPFAVDRVFVTLVGVFALLLAWGAIAHYRDGEREESEFGDVERVRAVPSPGDGFGDAIRLFLPTSRLHYQRRRIREALHAAAVSVLTRYEGYAEDAATAAIESGTWTTNRDAAAFLGGDDADPAPIRSLVRDVARREPSFYSGIRYTVNELATMAGRRPAGSRPPRHVPDHRASSDREEGNTIEMPEAPEQRTEVETGHWRGVSAVALVGIGVGILAEQPAVLLAGVAGIGFAAYARASTMSPDHVTVERTLDTGRPSPGEDVTVTVTVRNDSDRFLPDVRVVDGVPDALAVTEGSPRLGTALRAGEAVEYTYAITARRGEHPFGPVRVAGRDLTSSTEQEWVLPVETSLTCIPPVRPLTTAFPLRARATQYVGAVQTESGGEGIEFYATREYRPNDALRRIDWNRRAKTGEFTTVEFREERAATVVVLVDARQSAYRAPEPHLPHAVDRSVDAAGRIFASLADAGNRVGLAAMGNDDCWLGPGTGGDHRIEARQLLATHPAFASAPQDDDRLIHLWRDAFRERLASGTQIVLITPLCDDYVGEFGRRFDAYGYPVTIVSPDASADRTTGHVLAMLARDLQIGRLRSAGIPVVDWAWDETVDVAVARHAERWSR